MCRVNGCYSGFARLSQSALPPISAPEVLLQLCSVEYGATDCCIGEFGAAKSQCFKPYMAAALADPF
jgi:hypothetical protein